jgi:hypothetical protein
MRSKHVLGQIRVCRDRRQHVFGHFCVSEFANLAFDELSGVWQNLCSRGQFSHPLQCSALSQR